MSSSSRAIVAAAGSGKTAELLNIALAISPGERILITTYTDNNANSIRSRLKDSSGSIPANVTVMPWFTFLIREGVRPYQHPTLGINEVRSLHFKDRKGYPPRKDVRSYYLTENGNLYRNYVSELVLDLNERENSAVIRRLEAIYRHVLIDEVQDLSSRDLDLVELILKSSIRTVLVGDPRQRTYATTNSRTNRRFAGANIVSWLEGLEAAALLTLDQLNHSHRCTELICRFADSLYPQLPTTASLNSRRTPHDGVFLLRPDDVRDYAAIYAPQLLVWDKDSENYGLPSRNMGEVKGLEYDRVVVGLTDTMSDFLQSGTKLPPISLAKLYVAVTRARQSVGLVLKTPGSCKLPYWRVGVSSDAVQRSLF